MGRKILDWREGEEQCAELEWEDRFSWDGKYTFTKYELENICIASHSNEGILRNPSLSLHTWPIQEYNTTEYKFYYTVLVQSLMMTY